MGFPVGFQCLLRRSMSRSTQYLISRHGNACYKCHGGELSQPLQTSWALILRQNQDWIPCRCIQLLIDLFEPFPAALTWMLVTITFDLPWCGRARDRGGCGYTNYSLNNYGSGVLIVTSNPLRSQVQLEAEAEVIYKIPLQIKRIAME